MYYYDLVKGGSVHLPLHDFGSRTWGSVFTSETEVIDSGAVERSANIIPIKRQFTVEGRIWEPQHKSGNAKLTRLVDDDRISNLPVELIHCIFAHLPVHDVAKTSILSKTWRNIWKMHTRLILDSLFFLQVNSKKIESRLSAFSAAVDMILFVHTGSILDFKLYVPPKLLECHIHRWIEHLSNKGIRALELSNSEKNACLSSSYIFHCSELTQLKLFRWILNPPQKSECFCNLISVRLVEVSITADMSFGNQLQELDLLRYNGIERLSSQFTNNNNFRRLVIVLCDTIDWRCFIYPNKLEVFDLLKSTPNYLIDKSVNLITLFGSSPRISSLSLDDLAFEVPGSVLERFTTKMVNLKKLRLYKLKYNLCQISNSLCLIRNLPNLQDLNISLKFEVMTFKPLQSTIERYLESVEWADVFLHRLQSFEISGAVGSRSALHLIKLLLSSSLSLKVMLLVCTKKACNPNEKFRIEQELLQLPRISSQAQLFWHTREREELLFGD